MRRLPDFFIAGVPKAGTTALHSALSEHPQLLMSSVKETKHFLCNGEPPRLMAGPGDNHSAKEWIWRRSDYERLFDGPEELVRGESTPLYLYVPEAQARIAEAIPNAKFIVVLRDPVDRAHSNWLHLWSDGLEPIADFERACDAEPERIRAGWAPFWHYKRIGRYGEQIETLLSLFQRSQLLVVRYRHLVDRPSEVLDKICEFLGVDTGLVRSTPAENTRGLVVDSRRKRVLSTAIRVGAQVGSLFPPRLWRVASAPLTRALHATSTPRPQLEVEVRRRLIDQYRDDIARLEHLTGESFADWLGDRSLVFAGQQPASPLTGVEGSG